MRSRKRLRLLAVPPALFAIVWAVAAILFAHRPWAIPPELKAPPELVPGAQPGLQVKYTGVTGYEITDGDTVLLVDPVLTRPTVNDLVSGPLAVDDAAVADAFPRADFILVNHAHFDHGIDAPAIAKATGATVLGSPAAVNLALSRGVPAEQTRVVKDGDDLTLGTFRVRVAEGAHAPILGMTLMRGPIPADAGPLWFFQYRQDGAFAFHLESPAGTLLFHPQSGYIGERLPPADAIVFGLAGYDLTEETLAAIQAHTRPRVLFPTHYDNFLQPRSAGMALLPVLDFEGARAILDAHRAELAWWLLDYGQAVTVPRTSTAAAHRLNGTWAPNGCAPGASYDPRCDSARQAGPLSLME
ncbi:MAG: MBL fold metallo-hydrolase [Myxococcales bacterium]|nr:MBL fold metallo-hydrolase [Myxococcales bacterium]